LVLKGQTNNIADTNNNRVINGGIFRNIAGGSSGAGAVAQNLNDLSDVTITTPSNGQSLVYNSGTWENGTPSLASTSSFATQALTSSFATQALTSSFATQALTASFATTALTASFLDDGYITLTTTSDQDVTNNNSANAPELFFSGSANAVYEIEFKLIMSSNNTTADSRFGFRTGTGGNVLMGAATIPSISTTFGGAAQLMQVSSSFTSVVPMGTPPAADLRYPLTATGTICLFISANDTIGVTFGNSTATIGATTRLWAGSTVKYKRIK
jgi:hypothetical protein